MSSGVSQYAVGTWGFQAEARSELDGINTSITNQDNLISDLQSTVDAHTGDLSDLADQMLGKISQGQLTTSLSSYVTRLSADQLYINQTELDTALEDYATTAALSLYTLNAAMAQYIKGTGLAYQAAYFYSGMQVVSNNNSAFIYLKAPTTATTWTKKYLGDSSVSYPITTTVVSTNQFTNQTFNLTGNGLAAYMQSAYPDMYKVIGELATNLKYRLKVKINLNVYFNGPNQTLQYKGASRTATAGGPFTSVAQVDENSTWFLSDQLQPSSTYGAYIVTLEGTTESYGLNEDVSIAFIAKSTGSGTATIQSVTLTYDVIVDGRTL